MNIRDHPFLWQWDRNRALFVNEPGALYVDFDRPGETPDRRKVVDGIAEISDTWLQKAGAKNVYICVQGGTLIGYTLLILPRPKPPDYAAEPDKVWSYDDLQRVLEAKIQAVQNDLDAAKEKSAADIAAMDKALAAQKSETEAAYASLTASLTAQTDRVAPLKEAVDTELAKKPDTTLSIAGEAADAKAAGDAMNQLADTCKLIADRLAYSDLRAFEDLAECGVITPAADRSNFTEPAASTGYARAQIGTINTRKSGQVANDEIIFCFEATAAVGQLTYLGLFDTKTGGKPFFTAELTSPISVAANTVPLIRRNQLVVALDKDAIEAY